MSAPITSIYAALGAVLILALGLNVSIHRRTRGIGLGEGAHGELCRVVRAHANTVEYLPLALLLLLLLEVNGTAAWLLHAFGAALIGARIGYAQGLLTHGPGVSLGRFLGTLVTWSVMAATALMLLWRAMFGA
ncbi:MAG: MAPEG family protein [Halofilum sp. (in: g-proteobacteria)]